MDTKEFTLTEDIVELLSRELRHSVAVVCLDGQVTVVLSRTNCEQNYGNIVQQIQRVIDEYCPDRSQNIVILVGDETGVFKNRIKIWKPV